MSHGKKPVKLDVDVNAKLIIVRSTEGEKGKQNAQATKKLINIPIGDVIVDTDYEVNVTPTFQVPTSFVRHTKKIGDEADISIDYFMEDEDLFWMRNNPRIAQDRDISTYLGIETFEKIITLLEKHTGFVTDLIIPQIHAERLISDKLKWPAHISSKIVPEVYQYWIKKREKCMKPLCRKYWPSTSASDTNPHHVFRTRDKERYRLRKQQRKNDVEAYRKMQQLRREFGRARELLQLVVERETLREAGLSVRKEIFELQLYELDMMNSNDSNNKSNQIMDRFGLRKEFMSTTTSTTTTTTAAASVVMNTESSVQEVGDIPHHQLPPITAYKLLYPHLLDTPAIPHTKITLDNNNSGNMNSSPPLLMNIKASKLQQHLNTHSSDTKLILNRNSSNNSNTNINNNSNNNSNLFNTNNTSIHSINKSGVSHKNNNNSTTMMSIVSSSDTANNTDIGTGVDDPAERMKDRKLDKKQKRKLNALNSYNVTFAATATDGVIHSNNNDSATHPAVPATDTAPVSPFPVFVHYPGMPGPAKLCRPLWPSFMADTDGCRERVTYMKSYVEYLNDIQLRHPLPQPLGGISGVSCQSRSLGANPYDCPELINNDNNDSSYDYPANNSNSSNISCSSSLYPRTFRTRGRIGRGGRYVMDRIPVYTEYVDQDTHASTAGNTTANSTTCAADSMMMPYISTATQQQHTTIIGNTNTAIATTINPTTILNNSNINSNNNRVGGRKVVNKTKFVYATRMPPYMKPHRGAGVELMMQSHVYGENSSHTSGSGGNNNSSSSSGGGGGGGDNNHMMMMMMSSDKLMDELTSATRSGYTRTNNSTTTTITSNNSNSYNSNNNNNNNNSKTKSAQLNTSFPIAMPLSRGALPVSLKQREKEIYDCSDSEDEVVEYNNTTVTTRFVNKKAKNNHSTGGGGSAAASGGAESSSGCNKWSDSSHLSLMSKYCLHV